jgi:hypothetical protein
MSRLRSLIWTIGSLLGIGMWVLLPAPGRPAFGEQAALTPMPTPDRLAAPPLPANPTQLQSGAYAFWLHCMPCHGDQGQGLTPEFRQLYPEDHRNCWASGCHGAHPYPDGWSLPSTVPALIGPGSLTGFSNAAALQSFIQGAMPFEDPGSLDSQTYWAITAYLAQAHGANVQGIALDSSSAGKVSLEGVGNADSPSASAAQTTAPQAGLRPLWLWAGLLAAAAIVAILGGLATRNGRRRGK